MTKINFITPTVSVGGIQSVVLRLCKAFSDNGHRVNIFSFESKGLMKEELEDNNVSVKILNLTKLKGDVKLLFGFPWLVWNLYKVRNETFIATSGLSSALAIILSTISKSNKFYIILDNDITASEKIHHKIYNKFIMKFSYKLNGVVFTYNLARRNFERLDYKKPDKVKIIHNPVDNNFTVHDKKEYDFIFVGRMSKEKAPEVFVRCLKKVNNRNGIMLGSGELEGKIKHSLHDTKNINYIGYTKNVSYYMKKSSCLVLTSIFEGCSGVVKEALSLGIPCIVSNVKSKAPFEMINYGEFGEIYFNENDLIEKMKSFNPMKYDKERMIQHSKKFHIEYVISEYLDLIN
ncbi:glycosyltransferase [Vibrio jasicida]|uniref:glycosyltransferase n=1 Tax=Vibrio jasicida TaxID=766224 RepID=UPI0005EEB05F|nr:glycosyltransferase [Vibrio jasicida]